MLLCIYELAVLLKYVFYLPESVFLFVISFCQILKSVIIYLVCLFFATRAVKGDDQSKKMTQSLKLGFYLFLVVFTGIFAYQVSEYERKPEALCSSVAFILPDLFNCLVSTMFIFVGI